MTEWDKIKDESWKKILTEQQYRVMREHGTEPAFSGDHLRNKKRGKYLCAACGQELFSSKEKYESGTGWPSYYAPISKKALDYEKDLSHGENRTEVLCSRCKSHLGHVFDDGPRPTGKRYCVNSVALVFRPD